jgi:MFS family permease
MRYFGMRAYSVLYGVLMIGFASALPMGAILFGQLFDRYGDYRVALFVGTAFLLTAAALFPLMGRYPEDDSLGRLSD